MLFGIKTAVESQDVFHPSKSPQIHFPKARKGGGLKGLTGREKLPLVPFQLDFPSIDSLPARDNRFQQNRPD
jgi:hypothetical protein